EIYPKEISAYRKLAKLYAVQGAFHNAAIYLNKLKEVEPSSEVYLELGRVYRALGKYDLALKNFAKAADLDKDNPQIPYEISLTYMKSNQYRTADKFIQKADQKATKKRDRKVLEKINQMESEIDRKLMPKERTKAKERKRSKSFDYFSEIQVNGNSGQLNKGYFYPFSRLILYIIGPIV
ncbi:MAG: tetratricopeptide repeat protein, partial [Candidatus Omnitrophica bacterium]|nr:tetratricopeptide repeat protein [Candidatus Omnitrophota bacterium]